MLSQHEPEPEPETTSKHTQNINSNSNSNSNSNTASSSASWLLAAFVFFFYSSASIESPYSSPRARLQISGRRRADRTQFGSISPVMRRGRALLLLALLVVAAVAAEDSSNILPAGTNNGSNIADSGVGKIEQNDATNPNTQHKVHEDGGLKNDVAESSKTDNSVEGTSTGRDEPVQNPKDKNDNTTKSSTEFLQDPLIRECDPSHRCLIEKKKFIACLKVPGEDSLALSLLMDNKGMNPLDVSITAPDYVTLAEDTVHVEANDHNETQVSVSISYAVNDMTIVLKVAEGNCSINLHTAVTRNKGRVIPMRLTSTYMLVPVFVLLGLVGVCIKLRRARKQDGGPAYQKLDAAELPVSIGGKKEADQPDQWDDNWGDDWDDEEAPSTPSNSMPNPSSKGLASRRSTKDGWKD